MAAISVSMRRKHGGGIVKPMLIGFAVFYLCYHVFHGERGLVALWREQHEQARLEMELAKQADIRMALERRVHGLRSTSLDRDLLDEQMRRLLGVQGKNEWVVLGK
jgi:cell division protein FtsB